ncbi:Alcohol dehydrogenase superfamily, zinc-containing [Rhodovulum sp. PH10]|uniref:zinc-dependent alcohol dehydrogenase n=1 Tax=Rhodovulum sp. PH10 TaxID=1187851 RepID=UPI00027C2324|nr:zinc-binding dehydrogenase [Rhodovulum sp. PH10]EJW12832.1 Alcohol dehydrogenase superfamily, zinc-containing [Rhodovulum sp. PH10]
MSTSTDKTFDIPSTMKAWVLDDPGELRLTDKPVPEPGHAEVLVRVDAIAFCAGDISIITKGPPALVHGGKPFNKNFTPGHEYVGTVVKLGAGVDEFELGDRVVVEVHFGCGRCERCRAGMYTACLNYGMNYEGHDKGHRANGFTTDGGFAEYAVNHVSTLIHVPDEVGDEEATLIVTAGTAMYALDTLNGLVAGESVVVLGPGAIGLMVTAVAKALGAQPVILTGTRDERLALGTKMGADHVVNIRKEDPVEAVKRITGGKGVNYVVEASGDPSSLNTAMDMLKRGGKICMIGFPEKPASVDVARLIRNHLTVYGIRGEGKSATHRVAALIEQKKFDPKPIHTHTFGMEDVPKGFRYSRDRIEDAIKVVIKMKKD